LFVFRFFHAFCLPRRSNPFDLFIVTIFFDAYKLLNICNFFLFVEVSFSFKYIMIPFSYSSVCFMYHISYSEQNWDSHFHATVSIKGLCTLNTASFILSTQLLWTDLGQPSSYHCSVEGICSRHTQYPSNGRVSTEFFELRM
jgi:hypothetical protein